MAVAVAERLGRMSPEQFRRFYEERPEEERWELFDGVPLMMSPALLMHNRIGGCLERLLNDALSISNPALIAQQRPGLELPEAGNYRPEPDLAVIDFDLPADQRYATHAYLLAEIVSDSDRDGVPGTKERRMDAKRRIYRRHEPCLAVLTIEQDQINVLVETRTGEGWASARLSGADDKLILPAFGLRCRAGDLYANTPLMRHGRTGS